MFHTQVFKVTLKSCRFNNLWKLQLQKFNTSCQLYPFIAKFNKSITSTSFRSTGISKKVASFSTCHYQQPKLYGSHLKTLNSQKTNLQHVGILDVTNCNHSWRLINLRHFTNKSKQSKKNTSTVIYVASVFIFMVGMAYAGVPLYRIFCQAAGLGGQAVQGHDVSSVETMTPVKERLIRIRFNADTASSMQWKFRPQQTQVQVLPGETALAFYTATNPTDKPIIGISTYNVVPFEAGQYFNKIQCFCFEEQRLNPREQVDMPVFFYIDPEFAEDPKLEEVDTITLSYTFFEAKEGMTLPLPGYPQFHGQA